jgi:hypothetical protein
MPELRQKMIRTMELEPLPAHPARLPGRGQRACQTLSAIARGDQQRDARGLSTVRFPSSFKTRKDRPLSYESLRGI